MFDNLPLVSKWVEVLSSGGEFSIDALTMETLSAPEDVLSHGWAG
jgi:hypothetical protein